MTAREILLVRHGVGAAQTGRCIGWTDVPLSEEGAAAARAFARSGSWRPARLLTSDLARAAATARELATAWSLPAATIDARLREMHFGAWEGRTWEALAAEDGSRLDAWMARWWECGTPDGEGFLTLQARVRAWWSEVIQADTDQTPLCVVSHAGPIRALLAHLLEMPPAAAFRLEVLHARGTLLRVAPDGSATIALLNGARLPH